MTQDAHADDDLVGADWLQQRYAVSRRTLQKWAEEFGFPQPDVIINARMRRWRKGTVFCWERARTAEKNAEVA